MNYRKRECIALVVIAILAATLVVFAQAPSIPTRAFAVRRVGLAQTPRVGRGIDRSVLGRNRLCI